MFVLNRRSFAKQSVRRSLRLRRIQRLVDQVQQPNEAAAHIPASTHCNACLDGSRSPCVENHDLVHAHTAAEEGEPLASRLAAAVILVVAPACATHDIGGWRFGKVMRPVLKEVTTAPGEDDQHDTTYEEAHPNQGVVGRLREAHDGSRRATK